MTWRSLSTRPYVKGVIYNAKILSTPASIVILAVTQLEVGRCRLTVSKPVLKAPMLSAIEARM
jgi:hypothetical protein